MEKSRAAVARGDMSSAASRTSARYAKNVPVVKDALRVDQPELPAHGSAEGGVRIFPVRSFHPDSLLVKNGEGPAPLPRAGSEGSRGAPGLDGPSAALVGDVAADAVLIARDEHEAARPRMSDVVLHDGLARRAASGEEVEDEAVGLRREVDDPPDQPDGLRAGEHDVAVEKPLQLARPLPRVADLVLAPDGLADRARAHFRQEPLQPRDVVARRPEPDAPVRD